jgi:antitoxin (DNA-binding transcriptional repressor) of toxin-antitoxin stability system
MNIQEQINQSDLKLHSDDIMDAVEHGQSFTVIRDGRPMGKLIPLRRRFVTRAQFAVSSQNAVGVDLKRFRADQDAFLDGASGNPYEPYER